MKLKPSVTSKNWKIAPRDREDSQHTMKIEPDDAKGLDQGVTVAVGVSVGVSVGVGGGVEVGVSVGV